MKITLKNFFNKFTSRRNAATTNTNTEMEVRSMNEAAQAAVIEAKQDGITIATTSFINSTATIDILDPAVDAGLEDLFEEDPYPPSCLHIIRDNVEYEVDDLLNNCCPTWMLFCEKDDLSLSLSEIIPENIVEVENEKSFSTLNTTICTTSDDDDDDDDKIKEICQEISHKSTFASSVKKPLQNIAALSRKDAAYLLEHVLKCGSVEYLNSGAFGLVFKVCQPIPASLISSKAAVKFTDNEIACKLSVPDSLNEDEETSRWSAFVKELKVLRQLRAQPHPNICPSYGQFVLYCGADDTNDNYTMTAVTDETCADICHRQNGARLPLLTGLTMQLFPMSLEDWMMENQLTQLDGDMLCRFFTQIGAALVHLHTHFNLTHDDLHSGNIAVYNGMVLKLFDFGIARTHESNMYDAARMIASEHTLDQCLTVDNELKRFNPFLVEAEEFSALLLDYTVRSVVPIELEPNMSAQVDDEAELDAQNAQHCAFKRVLIKVMYDPITNHSVTIEWMLRQYYDQLQ